MPKDHDRSLVLRSLVLLVRVGLFPFEAAAITCAKDSSLGFGLYALIIFACLAVANALHPERTPGSIGRVSPPQSGPAVSGLRFHIDPRHARHSDETDPALLGMLLDPVHPHLDAVLCNVEGGYAGEGDR